MHVYTFIGVVVSLAGYSLDLASLDYSLDLARL